MKQEVYDSALMVESLWREIRSEAQQFAASEPLLASFYHASILNHDDLAAALSFQIASRLGCDSVPTMLVREVFNQAYSSDSGTVVAAAADIRAHYERDPACDHFAVPFLYFKGFQAIQGYRIAHWLWSQGRRSMALFLQNRIATVFDVDIHPAAVIGHGIMVDHATGVVIGETARLGNNVSLLHSVTLGGCGSSPGDRHPKVGDWVLLSAGAKLLGNIHVGEGARIAAGSVVLENVPSFATVAGVPARIVSRHAGSQPARDMDQVLHENPEASAASPEVGNKSDTA